MIDQIPNLAKFHAAAGIIRRRLFALAKKSKNEYQFYHDAQKLVKEYAEPLGESLKAATLAAFDKGRSPPLLDVDDPDDDEIKLPLIDEAFLDMQRRHGLRQDDYGVIDADARRAAFTVARLTTDSAVNAIKAEISRSIQTGLSQRKFRRNTEAILSRHFAPQQVDAIFRTQVGQAYSAGQRELLADPFVESEFPFLEWIATHDTRVDKSHLAMEQHGIDGTGIYWATDPLWKTHWPPIRWNCRCVVIPLSIQDAAAKGVKAAQRWLETGMQPVPQFAAIPYPARVGKNWPSSTRITAVV